VGANFSLERRTELSSRGPIRLPGFNKVFPDGACEENTGHARTKPDRAAHEAGFPAICTEARPPLPPGDGCFAIAVELPAYRSHVQLRATTGVSGLPKVAGFRAFRFQLNEDAYLFIKNIDLADVHRRDCRAPRRWRRYVRRPRPQPDREESMPLPICSRGHGCVPFRASNGRPTEALRASQQPKFVQSVRPLGDGGGGRTRTCEAMRRLICSPLLLFEIARVCKQ
jgi:hypothetical protein